MTYETPLSVVGRYLLVAVMVGAGVAHFTHGELFAAMVPAYLPWPMALVLVSGVFELVLGLGLLPVRTRRLAAYGLVALFIAVFPANIDMALHPEVGLVGAPDWLAHPSPLALWLRLPLQLLLIYWALSQARVRLPRA
jgi:uncharacterized membrane protein